MPRGEDRKKRLRRGDGEEIARLEKMPLTETGRRILMRHAMTSPTGQVGTTSLSEILGCHELTIWKLIKIDNDTWCERARYEPLVNNLCALLRCDRSWLFHSIDYGDLGAINFDIHRRVRWRIRDVRPEESYV
jgi:hypothetical protein